MGVGGVSELSWRDWNRGQRAPPSQVAGEVEGRGGLAVAAAVLRQAGRAQPEQLLARSPAPGLAASGLSAQGPCGNRLPSQEASELPAGLVSQCLRDVGLSRLLLCAVRIRGPWVSALPSLTWLSPWPGCPPQPSGPLNFKGQFQGHSPGTFWPRPPVEKETASPLAWCTWLSFPTQPGSFAAHFAPGSLPRI